MNNNGLLMMTILCVGAEGCMRFQREDTATPPRGIWDDMEHKRHVVDCSCGSVSYSDSKGEEEKPWHVYIYTKANPTKPDSLVCSGTIITSNLVATSHKCLTLPGTRMNLFDAYVPKAGAHNVVSEKDIVISGEPSITSDLTFPVEQIIFSNNYAISSAFNLFPVSDILLLRVTADFTNHPRLKPICIPAHQENLNVSHQPVHYYGAGLAKDDSSPIREITDTQSGLQIANECDKELGIPSDSNKTITSSDDSLCIRFVQIPDTTPETPGGALVLTSDSTIGSRAFIFGVATKIGISDMTGMGDEFVYFSSIPIATKYVEHQANLHKSRWCETSKFVLKNVVGANTARARVWPWESMRTPIIRDESLDCACGVENIQGRVVGGVKATPYVFGWMTIVHVYPKGRSRSPALCGGSIINDRVIMTAAHCVVLDSLVLNGAERVTISPENVEVIVDVHLRHNDAYSKVKKVAAVFHHPKYVEPRLYDQYDYDIALLVLQERLNFGEAKVGINTICVPKMGEQIELVGRKATVTGWGLKDPDDPKSVAESLEQIELDIQDLKLCSDAADSLVSERFICAGTLDRNHDAASGDSGGPLMTKIDNRWKQVGIVSWGEDIRDSSGEVVKTAALYSHVPKLLPFVDYHSKRLKAKWCKS